MPDIKLNKEKINANMYYNLFEPAAGKFEPGQNILFIHLGNFDVYYKFIANNLNCNYFIIDKTLCKRLLKAIFPQIEFIGSEEDESIIEKLENLNMKFDKIIMNPPWGNGDSVGLGQKILKTAMNFGKDIVCLYADSELYKIKNKKRMDQFKHCDNIKIIAGNLFDINSRNNGIICHFNTEKIFEKVEIIDQIGHGWSGIYNYNNINICEVPKQVYDFFLETEETYNELFKTSLERGMTNLSNDMFEYFENKEKPGHKNIDVENSKYKFILNRTSYENLQDSYYDVVKNKGGVTWTCATEEIKNNIYYWLHDCPLVFLWRKIKILDTVANCKAYKSIPTVDFTRSDFREYVDSLCNNFNKRYSIDDIIKILNQC